MSLLNPVLYRVYYMNNDRQKVIIQNGLSYFKAIDLCQQNYNIGLSCEYETYNIK